MDLDALLARVQADREDKWQDAQVVLAGEIVDVSLARVDGTTWVELIAAHHPRTATDGRFGYNLQAASRVYSRVSVWVSTSRPTRGRGCKTRSIRCTGRRSTRPCGV